MRPMARMSQLGLPCRRKRPNHSNFSSHGRNRFAVGAFGLIALSLSALPGSDASAHEVQHQVATSEAVVVTLRYADGTAFSYEEYELTPGDETIPIQIGRSDALGRVVFLPQEETTFRLRCFSADGHGVDFTFKASPQGEVSGRDRGWFDRYPGVFAGVGVILGLFGAVSLWLGRKRS